MARRLAVFGLALALRGKMDEMRIYDRALGDTEIKALFEGRACP